MRFLVMFREHAPVSSQLLERMVDRMVALGNGQGSAAIVEVTSEDELNGLLDREPRGVEAVPLSDEGFPITFGKHKGALAAWEKVMAGQG